MRTTIIRAALLLLFLSLFTGTAHAQIAQRGTATTATVTNNASLTITKPTGVVSGDLMIANLAQVGSLTSPTAPAGWTLIDNADLAGGTNRFAAVFYKVAGGAEGANYTFTVPTGAAVSVVGGIIAFSGVNTTTPFDVGPGTIQVNASSTTVTAATITTVSANTAIVMLGEAAGSTGLTWTNANWHTTSPANLTEILDAQVGGTGASIGAAFALKPVAAATGNGTATINSGERNGGILLALRPAPPLTFSKAFNPTSMPVAGTSTLTFTIVNPSATTAQTTVAVTDTLPAGVQVAGTPAAANSGCGAPTWAPAAAATTLTFSGGTVAVSGTCTFSVNVTATTSGLKTNTTGTLTSSGGSSGTATAQLAVEIPATIAKAFAPTSVAVNVPSTLTITITNPAANTVALTGLGVSDTFPAGLVVAATPNATNTCGGTFTPTAGAGSIALSAGTVNAASSCAISVAVSSPAAGSFANTTGNVNSTNGGPGTTASATLTVTQPASIAKAFAPTTIPLSGTSTLTLTITNPSATQTQTGLAVSDPFPAGLAVASTPALTNTCGGTITGGTAGSTTLSLSGGSLPVSSSCAISVSVAPSTAGSKANTTGSVSSTNGGTGNTGSATLTVMAPPTITKTFAPTSMPVGGTTTLTLSFANPAANGATGLTGVAVTDPLPAGLQVAAAPATTNTCSATFAPNPGDTTLTVTGGSLAGSSGTCAVSVAITATTSGVKNNTTNAVTSTNGGTGLTANASLAVEVAPTITKSFSPTTISPAGTSLLTLTITNPAANTVALTGLAISDTFPTNMVVATPANLTNTCGGTPAGSAGASTVSLTGGTVATSSSCLISFNVTASVVGSYVNTTGNVSSTNGGTGTSATATLTVAAPPTTVKTFAPTTIALNGISTLTVTITNPASNSGAMTGIAVSDTFPAGMVLAGTPNANNTCGGTFTPAAGSLTLSGGSIATPGATCEFNADVTATSNGAKNNTTSTVTTTNDGTGTAAAATLAVVSPPAIAKAFAPTNIAVNGTSTLTFTLTNPTGNTVAESGVAFSDTFPSDLVVAGTPALTNTCGGSVTGATAASNTISLSGGTINTPAGTTCTISVAVTAPTAGAKANTTGTVSSTNGGTGTTASATLTVNTAPTFTKSFAPTSMAVNGTSTLSLVITNPAGNVALTGLAFSDTFPTNMKVGGTPALTNSCGGTVTGATANSTTVSLSGGTVGVNTSCTISFAVTATAAGSYLNTTSTLTSTNAGTVAAASATLNVLSPPGIAKAFNPTSVSANGISTLTLTFSNSNASALTGVNITDTFPTGVAVANPPNINNVCGATLSGATAGSGSVSYTNITIPANSSCIVAIDVTPSTGGSKVNTTGTISSTNGGNGGTATATLTVNQAPTITSAASATFILSAVSSFQVTATGTPAPAFSEVGTLPTGINFSSAGLFSGTPTQAGSFPITITATNGNAPDATQAFTLSVISQVNATQPFFTGHGWTYTQLTCSGGTCSNNAAVNTANCGPSAGADTGTHCVSATQSLVFNTAQTMTGYFRNAAGVTWASLGVPAGATVTSVQGGWFDRITEASSGCAAAGMGLQIFDAANTTQLSASPIVPLIDVSGDNAGVTHALGSAVLINTGQAAATGITIRLNMNPSVPIALAATCNIFGDNLTLAINYSLAASSPRRKGQVIIGMNAQPDGSMTAAWAYNVELNEGANPINLSQVKLTRLGRTTIPDTSTLAGDGRKVTKIKLEEN